ncbi:MAG: hypothetical protein COZ15_07130 [Elusimicrobia bacterium CG_4_10_14_3_um_filter_49_12_50_7]|nr:MAG: hypothetical protein COZ15_07130 [Elusimicrobia bacterium CG_4_10_14_3_um_filter_49_12_50_7]
MIFPRRILADLKKQIETDEIVVLTGMRRAGKTTLLRMIFDKIPGGNKVFLDIENPLEQQIFEETDYNNIWANLASYGISAKSKSYIFIDEIQAKPDVVRAVKYLHDHYKVKFFLTGSSSFYLKNLFPESLSGRKAVFVLYPLDFEEFLIFKGKRRAPAEGFKEKLKSKNKVSFEQNRKLYDEYLEYGGFPQVVLTDDNTRKKQQLNDILKSYFEKEVLSLAEFRQIKAFRDLMMLIMRRAGSQIDISKLASEVGVSRPTVYSYIYFLEATYFIDLISPFSRSVDREVSGTKKLYVCDNGILNQFGRVSEGAMFENAVYHDIRKYGEVKYYRKRSGAEIDFVLPDISTAVEIKRTGRESDYKKLTVTAKSLKLKENYIVTKNFDSGQFSIPAQDI